MEEFKKKMKTRISTLVVGQDGIGKKRSGVAVMNGLVDGKYKYRSDAVFYMRSFGVFLKPMLLYDENEIEPIYVRGKTDYGKRTIGKSANEFGLMIEDAAFALYEILRKKSTSNETIMFAMLAGVLAINVIILLAMFG